MKLLLQVLHNLLMPKLRFFLSGALILSSLLCTPAYSAALSSQLQLEPISFQQLPHWQESKPSGMLEGLKRSCSKMIRQSSTAKAMIHACNNMLKIPSSASNAQVKKALEQNYQAMRIDKGKSGLFTGYYAPVIPGSKRYSSTYRVPIYGKPTNLKRVRINGKTTYRLVKGNQQFKMASRGEIAKGPLIPNTPVLAYVKDKITRFFLQIQGSGFISLADGSTMAIGYDGENGHRYYAIGRYLLQKGYLTKQNISAQSIKDWLYAHPQQAQYVMNLNPSFVFFRRLSAQQVVGAQGVELTPMRSLAIDHRYYNYGNIFWLTTSIPNPKNHQDQAFNRLMIGQDTGGAIKGMVRGDIYFGHLDDAPYYASHMQNQGQLYLLRAKIY